MPQKKIFDIHQGFGVEPPKTRARPRTHFSVDLAFGSGQGPERSLLVPRPSAGVVPTPPDRGRSVVERFVVRGAAVSPYCQIVVVGLSTIRTSNVIALVTIRNCAVKRVACARHVRRIATSVRDSQSNQVDVEQKKKIRHFISSCWPQERS